MHEYAQVPYEHIVIVDEAAQCIEPETLVPLQYGGSKIVLVGDPMQLDATVLSRTAADAGLKTSLFSRLHSRLGEANRVFMLTEQVQRHCMPGIA